MSDRSMRVAQRYAAKFRNHRLNASTYASCVRDLVDLRDAADALLTRVVIDMRERGDYTFQEIADALGVSRQAATKRYMSSVD